LSAELTKSTPLDCFIGDFAHWGGFGESYVGGTNAFNTPFGLRDLRSIIPFD